VFFNNVLLHVVLEMNKAMITPISYAFSRVRAVRH